MKNGRERSEHQPQRRAVLRSYDVVALVTGVVFSSVALGALWFALIGPLPWDVIKIIAPLGLVAVGVVGLALSRNRS